MYRYSGKSMGPLFQSGDLLFYNSWTQNHLRKGDIILFKRPDYPDKTVVHRVVYFVGESISTKGDNNPYTDPWVLEPDDVIGIVVKYQRNKTVRKVYGGKLGTFWAKYISLRTKSKMFAFNLFSPLYTFLSNLSFLPLLASPFITLKVLRVDSPRGSKRLLLLGNKVIGKKDSGRRWKIKSPYGLIVDEYGLDSKI